MENIKKRFPAFTLAEVLITLGIVGVIAEMTIPSLLNNVSESVAVSSAKETYSTLGQAVLAWQSDDGCEGDTTICPLITPQVWPGGPYPHQGSTIARQIAQKLKVVDAYYGGTPTSEFYNKSWIPEDAYELNGRKSDYTSLFPAISKNIKGCDDPGWGGYLLLANGVVVKIVGDWWHYIVVFDINGVKEPNRIGKDQFPMSLYSDNHKTFNPYYYATYGSGYGVCADQSGTICKADDGHSPMAYVLMNNKLPDLKAMGYPETP